MSKGYWNLMQGSGKFVDLLWWMSRPVGRTEHWWAKKLDGERLFVPTYRGEP